MRTDILNQMEAVVNETMKHYKTDFFNHDKPRIASPEFKFPAIWIVGEAHTCRLELGNFKDLFNEAEIVRYHYVRDNNPYRYYCEDGFYKHDKWFLIQETGLQPITREQAVSAIYDYVNPAVQAWIAEHGPLPKDTKVPVKLHGISISELKELIQDCRNHDNDSLLSCMKRFHNFARISSDQRIEIYYNKAWNEFTFCEYVGDKQRLVGGIIFHGWPETGYKQNGACQIDPHYGWSSHT